MKTLASLLLTNNKYIQHMLEAPSSEVQQGRPFLPKAVRSARIIAIEQKTSSKGNPMLVIRSEIVAPEFEVIAGVKIAVSGLQFTDWMVYGNAIGTARVQALTKAVRGVFPIDLENPAVLRATYLGKGIRAEVSSEQKPLVQFNAELGVDEPVKDDNGNVVVDTNYRMGRVIGGDASKDIAPEMMPVKE